MIDSMASENASPFRVRCKRCNSVAESWHYTQSPPEGATIGMAYCECGKVGADSIGVPGVGRIVTSANLPEDQWKVLKD